MALGGFKANGRIGVCDIQKDVIYRQAVIDLITDADEITNFTTKGVLRSRVRKLPFAQLEREQGNWIDMGDHVMCSRCGATHYGVDKNFCQNCGADMRGGQMEANVKINCETNGFEDATEQVEALAEAYDEFPAQVTIKNCHYCTFNIYPSQTKFMDAERRHNEHID